jgi:hypothetical protein
MFKVFEGVGGHAFRLRFQDPVTGTLAIPGRILLSPDVGPPPGKKLVRGDVDASGAIDISDPINNLGYQFLGLFTPPCFDAADDDDSGTIDISDPIFSLTRQFLGGPIWPAPHPDCGEDKTTDPGATAGSDLGCVSYPPCGN